MNSIPGVVHYRSFSLFGLSDLKLVVEDGTDNAWNRERVLERLAQVVLPPGVVPQMGTDWSPVGQIYFFTLRSTNPRYDARLQCRSFLRCLVTLQNGLNCLVDTLILMLSGVHWRLPDNARSWRLKRSEPAHGHH